MEAKDRLIVALDVDSRKDALSIVDELKIDVKIFKIGFELFSSCGPSIVEDITKKGCRVFLDLKYHDIPSTVSKSAVSVAKLGVFILDLHALGGYDMMKRTAEAVKTEADRLKIMRPKVIAVTILTSMDGMALKKVGINDTIDVEVLRLAALARDAGLDGVVASPSETKFIRKELGTDFLIVTPGVRPTWAAIDDQKRIATPAQAIADGASFIVVGRPITGAGDRTKAVKKILEEIRS
jgi:orotidine-5'-phosphate decarboxylase